jgi:cysteinyl-tRNA synthetase
MPLRFLDTCTRKLETFAPIDPAGRVVKMYTCGPTVYDYAHIGNWRAYVFEDLLQRHLEYRGYAVERVMNLTDVDDKTIRGCRAAGQPLGEFTQKFKDAFFEDLKTLRIKPANHFPAATDPRHIARMIEMIALLMERGFAYQADDGSVYFRLNKFPDYGKLAHLNLDDLRPSGRVHSDEYEKESVGDFALWKAWDEADGDVAWASPWGRGRPGWHIECSAMATGILGPEIDIHCGGVDNIFPHHEAEIAQSESCTGKKFVRHWLHCAHLMVDGQKMSKSLGNFFTLRDLLAKGFTGREVRYALMSVNYRLPLNFTMDGLNAARAALQRIDEWAARLGALADSKSGDPGAAKDTGTSMDPHIEKFSDALDDDLNISGALGHLFDMIRSSNKRIDQQNPFGHQAAALLDWWKKINAVLAFEPDTTAIPPEVQSLLDERAAVRAAKDWKKSDGLRDKIAALGWLVKDTKDGQKLSKQA